MSGQRAINNNSLSHLIAEKIAEQIMSGELAPGEKIIETTYAEEYGTSRAPVREALYLLTIEGLIERIPRKGAAVKGYTEAEVYDLLEIRMRLEELAMERIAAMGVDTSLLNKMDDLVTQMEQAEQDDKTYAELNREYHFCIIEMTQSEIIKNMYGRLGLPLLSLQRMSFAEEKNIVKSVREHLKINTLLRDNKVNEAKDILKDHNQSVIERVRARLFHMEKQ
ncbi:GntR family transcriptional regulator [Alteribacillus iranensis]|uniref:DNA-binding transcriptional regulator, GntR family n=1 Tax=Alteribacillus iranensis TaxID=930128 RepID=A0A1I2DMK1_9BACI|nr:GntR family transcriptional regulator [Alteribacillus iranensis]SFE81844.1 DNA-binding transcriptional regulator, GntR family [Alteribacillus iranensis]